MPSWPAPSALSLGALLELSGAQKGAARRAKTLRFRRMGVANTRFRLPSSRDPDCRAIMA